MTRYVCSRCGFSRQSVKTVVKHIDSEHDGDARVMEHEVDDEVTSQTALGRIVEHLKRRL